jgi:ABC-type multidrug transport system fused ATPase/permease subunit
MILDEATSALDNINEKAGQAAMAEAVKGRILIVVAHRLTTISGADQLLVMCDGAVIEKGTPEQLLRQESFFAELNTSSVDLV